MRKLFKRKDRTQKKEKSERTLETPKTTDLLHLSQASANINAFSKKNVLG